MEHRKKLVDMTDLMCPLCGTRLNQDLKVGVFFDLLMEQDVMCHMACAESIGRFQLQMQVCHWRGADGVEKSPWVTTK